LGEKGPYITKVLDDGKLKIECKSRQGIVSLAGLEINKITYSKAFSDVKIKDWFYIPVMELASRGVIFGKGNDMFKPQDHIIGEHVAYIATFRSQINNIIGSFYYVKVMFNNHYRISRLHQSVKYADKPVHISHMKACSRLIQYIHCFSSALSRKLGGKFYPLSLASGQSGGRLSSLI